MHIWYSKSVPVNIFAHCICLCLLLGGVSCSFRVAARSALLTIDAMELDGDMSNLALDSTYEEEASDDAGGEGEGGADPVLVQGSAVRSGQAAHNRGAQAKSRATGKRHAAKQPPAPSGEDCKKCNCCKKFLDRDDFHDDQASCKKCNTTVRSIVDAELHSGT